MEKADNKHSILQGQEKECWVSGARNVPLEKHHIFHSRGQRTMSDKQGFWVYLTPEFHRGTNGVHGVDNSFVVPMEMPMW